MPNKRGDMTLKDKNKLVKLHVGIDEGMKRILKKYVAIMWTVFKWFRIMCIDGRELSSFIKGEKCFD
jgi:hypothetical protein